MNVSVMMTAKSINDFDEVNQLFSYVCGLRITWTDERLVWDPATYGGLTTFAKSLRDVWYPELVLSNPSDDVEGIGSLWNKVRVFSNGQVNWLPANLVKSKCAVKIWNYPYPCLRDYIKRNNIPSNRGGLDPSFTNDRHVLVSGKRNLASDRNKHVVTDGDNRAVTNNVYIPFKTKSSFFNYKRHSTNSVSMSSKCSGFSTRSWVRRKNLILPYRVTVHRGVYDNNWRHVTPQLGARAHYFLQVDDRHGNQQSYCSRYHPQS